MAHFMQQQPIDLEMWHNPLNGPFIVLSVLVSEGVDHLGFFGFSVSTLGVFGGHGKSVPSGDIIGIDLSPSHAVHVPRASTGSALPSIHRDPVSNLRFWQF